MKIKTYINESKNKYHLCTLFLKKLKQNIYIYYETLLGIIIISQNYFY